MPYLFEYKMRLHHYLQFLDNTFIHIRQVFVSLSVACLILGINSSSQLKHQNIIVVKSYKHVASVLVTNHCQDLLLEVEFSS